MAACLAYLGGWCSAAYRPFRVHICRVGAVPKALACPVAWLHLAELQGALSLLAGSHDANEVVLGQGEGSLCPTLVFAEESLERDKGPSTDPSTHD